MPINNKKSRNLPAGLALIRNKWFAIIIASVGLLVLLLTVFSLRSDDNTSPDTGSWGNSQNSFAFVSEDIDHKSALFQRFGLVSLSDCEAVLNYYKTNALERVTPQGLNGHTWPVWPTSTTTLEQGTTDQYFDSSRDSTYSTTNIQVQGVDEADLVKTDGKYIYLVKDRKFRIINLHQKNKEKPPTVIAEIDLETNSYDTQMLLSLKPEGSLNLKDTVIIIQPETSDSNGFTSNRLRLIQIDIDNRQSPEVVADYTIDGTYVGARLVDNNVRLVTTSSPLGFEWVRPSGGGLRAEAVALEANKEIIRNSDLSNWTPGFKNNLEKNTEIGAAINCQQMLAPRVFSGLDTLSIMTFNASLPMTADKWRTIGLAASGHEIYATPDNVYVAANEWIDPSSEDTSTSDSDTPSADQKLIVHKFGVSSSEVQSSDTSADFTYPVYMASGEVEGRLLNQFAMDEYKGDLRVAVTLSKQDGSENTSESHVKILRPEKGILKEIGTVTGLGIDEDIYAVRFMGAQAYVVTFRQIDPLYALDLSNPTDPKTLGELKIPDFSTYLHPVGENLLLGVGEEVSELRDLQLSLFDVSDPANLKRTNQLLLRDILNLGFDSREGVDYFISSSPAESDHRAFVFHKDIVYIPYYVNWEAASDATLPSSPQKNQYKTGVLAVKVDNSTETLVVENIFEVEADPASDSTDEADQTRENFRLNLARIIIVDDLIHGITYSSEMITWQMSDSEILHLLLE